MNGFKSWRGYCSWKRFVPKLQITVGQPIRKFLFRFRTQPLILLLQPILKIGKQQLLLKIGKQTPYWKHQHFFFSYFILQAASALTQQGISSLCISYTSCSTSHLCFGLLMPPRSWLLGKDQLVETLSSWNAEWAGFKKRKTWMKISYMTAGNAWNPLSIEDIDAKTVW